MSKDTKKPADGQVQPESQASAPNLLLSGTGRRKTARESLPGSSSKPQIRTRRILHHQQAFPLSWERARSTLFPELAWHPGSALELELAQPPERERDLQPVPGALPAYPPQQASDQQQEQEQEMAWERGW